MLDLRRSSASLDEYAALLERMLGFYEPLEEILFSAGMPGLPAAPDFEPRRKAHLLRNDLAALGVHRAAVQRCNYLPALQPGLPVVGAWYVVEGATRGGAVIARHLARQLDLTARNGALFFDCYGASREDRWQEYCALLASIPAQGEGEVTAGAVAVFDAMRRWLAERPAQVTAT